MTSDFKAQLIAMPLKVHRRLKTQLDAWVSNLASGIRVQFEPSFHPTVPLIDKVILNRIEKNIQEGYVHILVVKSRSSELLSKEFGLDCRVIAVSAYPPNTSWENFEAELNQKIRFESKWCEIIRPPDSRGPLFLPVSGFQPDNKYRDFWRACDCYGNESALDQALDLVRGLYATHHRSASGTPRYWVDSGDRVFKIDPTKHALYPEQRRGGKRFRFCALVPPGFHYDVLHARGKQFNLLGRDQAYKNIKRANVDPWGSVRLP